MSGTHVKLWTDMYRKQIYPVLRFPFAKKKKCLYTVNTDVFLKARPQQMRIPHASGRHTALFRC